MLRNAKTFSDRAASYMTEKAEMMDKIEECDKRVNA
jgi:hypothetical protein